MILLLAAAWSQVPPESRQLITAWASDVESSHAELQRWERVGGAWVPVGPAVPARLGEQGLAWGSGLHPDVPDERPKLEGDGRAPMGLFDLGVVFTELPEVAPRWPVVRTSVRDLWVEDPLHPAYNTHVRVDAGRALTPWETDQRMKLDDPAHVLKLVVAHNSAPPVPGRGSAIFLHVWRRDGQAPTAGCTAMDREALRALVDWLDPDARPVYALLDRGSWTRRGEGWGLPPLPPTHTSARPQEKP